MSQLVELPAITLWAFAARVAAAPAANSWSMVTIAGDRIEQEAADLVDELATLLEVPVKVVRVGSAHELLKAVRNDKGTALVLIGLAVLGPEQWRWLDSNRSELSRDLPVVMMIDTDAVRTVVEHAPNLWSWLGGCTWRSVPERGLSDEQREARLSALREHFGFDDVELIRRAEAGMLPREPRIGEWLVLLGKGHLIAG